LRGTRFMAQATHPRVLIVEDEPIILFYEAELAEGAGFIAIMASNSDEAIRELESSPDIEILLTDVNMPGSMDGLALAVLVHQRWPDIRIVIASGRNDTRDPDLRLDSIFVAKPFTPSELISALGRLTH
jgi:CheY-like chemotaxis protein